MWPPCVESGGVDGWDGQPLQREQRQDRRSGQSKVGQCLGRQAHLGDGHE